MERSRGYFFLYFAWLPVIGCLPAPAKIDTSQADSDADTDADVDSDCAPPDVATIPHGTFTMGSPRSEVGRGTDETQHEVTLTHDFYIGTTEVTQDAFERCMGYNTSHHAGDGTLPVEEVTWHVAASYANMVSIAAGLASCYFCKGSGLELECESSGNPYDCAGYRLPTEAEWEYAARAGSTAAYADGGNLRSGAKNGCRSDVVLDSGRSLGDSAWFCQNSQGETHPVGSLDANAWGLRDVHGNVYEWVGDRWDEADYNGASVTDPTGDISGGLRIIRGGSWAAGPEWIRAAERNGGEPDNYDDFLGIRLSRTKP